MSRTVRLLADENIYRLEEYLPTSLELTTFDPLEGIPESVAQHHALLVRTVSKINAETMPENLGELSFVATASAGFDHLDLAYLDRQEITHAHAGGCNARSVAEYVATALLHWSHENGHALDELSLGIVGVGYVGRAVKEMAEQLGLTTVLFDPPRARNESDFNSATLSEVLDSDLITFHTPLTEGDEDATHHWFNREKMRAGHFKLVINTARGGVIDEVALMASYQHVKKFVIDVWENEPRFDDSVAQKAYLATPHIGGYAKEAKTRATIMSIEAICEHFEVPYNRPDEATWAEPTTLTMNEFDTEQPSLPDVLDRLHPLRQYDHDLRQLIGTPTDKKGERFAKLRTTTDFRNEFYNVEVPEQLVTLHPVLEALGLKVV